MSFKWKLVWLFNLIYIYIYIYMVITGLLGKSIIILLCC